MFVPNDAPPPGPLYARWTIRSQEDGADCVILAEYGSCAFRARGGTQEEAWRRLCEQIVLSELPQPSSASLIRKRREWMEPVMACAGAVLGWLAPLVVKQTLAGAGATLYECAEGVLCPLFAFVGGGIGITCGGAWAAIRQRGEISRP